VSQQLGILQTRTTDTFLFFSHTTNLLLFKFRCNIFMLGSAFCIKVWMPSHHCTFLGMDTKFFYTDKDTSKFTLHLLVLLWTSALKKEHVTYLQFISQVHGRSNTWRNIRGQLIAFYIHLMNMAYEDCTTEAM